MTLSVFQWNGWWTGASGCVSAAMGDCWQSVTSLSGFQETCLLDLLGMTVPYSVCLHLVTSQGLRTIVVKLLLFYIFYIVYQVLLQEHWELETSPETLNSCSDPPGRKQACRHWDLLVAQISIFHAMLYCRDVSRKAQILKLAIFIALAKTTLCPQPTPTSTHITFFFLVRRLEFPEHTHTCLPQSVRPGEWRWRNISLSSWNVVGVFSHDF